MCAVRDWTVPAAAGSSHADHGGTVRRLHPSTRLQRQCKAEHPDRAYRRQERGECEGLAAPRPDGERVSGRFTRVGRSRRRRRARAGLRTELSPLDLHLWSDLPVPELGPVEPVLWAEVDAGLDGLMLATGGVWLESIPDAAKVYEGLSTVNGLKSARTRSLNGSEGVSLIAGRGRWSWTRSGTCVNGWRRGSGRWQGTRTGWRRRQA